MTTTGIPAEWRIAADEADRTLQVARAIEARQYPEGDAPVGLISSLVMAIALGRAARMVAEC